MARSAAETPGVPPYEVYEDRRKYPRIVIGCPVELTVGEQRLEGRIHDLSPDGLQVRCTRGTFQAIHPSGRFIHAEDAPQIDVAFSLDTGAQSRPVRATVRIYYFVLLPDEKELDVAFGVEFAEFRDRGEKVVEAFIADAMTPVEARLRAMLDRPVSSDELARQIGVVPSDVNAAIGKLAREGEIISVGSGAERRHMTVAAAIEHLLQRTDDLAARLAALEEKLRD